MLPLVKGSVDVVAPRDIDSPYVMHNDQDPCNVDREIFLVIIKA